MLFFSSVVNLSYIKGRWFLILNRSVVRVSINSSSVSLSISLWISSIFRETLSAAFLLFGTTRSKESSIFSHSSIFFLRSNLLFSPSSTSKAISSSFLCISFPTFFCISVKSTPAKELLQIFKAERP